MSSNIPEIDHPQPGLDIDERRIYTVRQLNQEVKQLLQHGFPLIWVEGEISNLVRPASGHMYFSLKDKKAQVRCTIFRNVSRQSIFRPENGEHVLVKAGVGLYEVRGDYQLNVEYMERVGAGALQSRYEELKRRLSQAGLFEQSHKQGPPKFPEHVCVITSPTGAAIRDIVSVLRRRYPLLSADVYTVPVQGEQSAEAIVDALDAVNRREDCDVIILARGGGSIEDLWSFNEEAVARAIFDSRLPVVTGIGHETDFTIADFVADVRAATPSAAAEIITPDQRKLIEMFGKYGQSLCDQARYLVSNSHQSIDRFAQRLELLHPKQAVRKSKHQLVELRRRIVNETRLKLTGQHNRLNRLLLRLENQSPRYKGQAIRAKFVGLHDAFFRLVHAYLEKKGQELKALTGALHAISPQDTLNRGYAIVMREEDKQVLRDADQVSIDERISIQLAKGYVYARIDEK